jgi:hypothetical protein
VIRYTTSCSRAGGGVPYIWYWQRDDERDSYTCNQSKRRNPRERTGVRHWPEWVSHEALLRFELPTQHPSDVALPEKKMHRSRTEAISALQVETDIAVSGQGSLSPRRQAKKQIDKISHSLYDCAMKPRRKCHGARDPNKSPTKQWCG